MSSKAIERLRIAADIVEKVKPRNFYMGNLDMCILGHCQKRAEFKELARDMARMNRINIVNFIDVAAQFFQVSHHTASYLFNGCGPHQNPTTAALALRKTADEIEKKQKEAAAARAAKIAEMKRRAMIAKGMNAVNSAIKEATAVPPPKAPTVKEEIEARIERARQRIAADSVLGIGLSRYRD